LAVCGCCSNIIDILFKLAKDVEIKHLSEKDPWLYGGHEENYERAMKTANHELKVS
jgi:hypothetical protein